MRAWMTLPLLHDDVSAAPCVPVLSGARPLQAGDAEALAVLMYSAYRDTVDDGGETMDVAHREVEKLLRGDFGQLDAPVSVVVERDARIASATIVTRDRTSYATGEAFIAFSMTAPEWKRQGLARWALRHVIGLLRMRGEPRVHLLVTCLNTPAVRLYESLGFVEVMRK